MATISVDRFLALHYHMRYPTLVTKKRAIYVTVTLWFGCLFRLAVIVGSALCTFVSTFPYIRIYSIVRRHQLHIKAQERKIVQNYHVGHSLRIVQAMKSALSAFIYYICVPP